MYENIRILGPLQTRHLVVDNYFYRQHKSHRPLCPMQSFHTLEYLVVDNKITPVRTWELTFIAHDCNLHFKMAASNRRRENRFTNSEKEDLVDIICNEEGQNADGEPRELILVNSMSKTISN